MAVTKIHQIHHTLDKAIDYILNKDKTDEMTLVSSNRCIPEIAFHQFTSLNYLAENKVNAFTEINKKGENVLAHHVIQSFEPGEISPEKANEIGVQLANEMFGDEYMFIVSTHVDKEHIHNHILINPRHPDTLKKFSTPKSTARKLRMISDKLCIDNGFSIIESPNMKNGLSYREWMLEHGKYDLDSKRKILKENIDAAILVSNSWNMFVSRMQDAGYEIKTRGKSGAFLKNVKYKWLEDKKYTRDSSLGDGYSREEIIKRIKQRNLEVAAKKKQGIEENMKYITINVKKLVVESSGTQIFTRLPGMKDKYFLFDRTKIKSLYIHNGKTLKIGIPKDMELTVYNKFKNPVSSMTTNQLYDFYDQVAVKPLDNQKLNEITDTDKTIKLSVDKRMQLHVSKHRRFRTKELTDVIATIAKENIVSLNDFDIKVNSLASIIENVEKRRTNAIGRINDLQNLKRYLEVRDKNKAIYSTYIKKDKNPDFYTKFKSEIVSYELAIQELEKAGMNVSADEATTVLDDLIKQQQATVFESDTNINSLKNRIDDLLNCKSVAREILVDKTYYTEADDERARRKDKNTVR